MYCMVLFFFLKVQCKGVGLILNIPPYDHQVALMDLVPNDKERGLKTPVWDEYKLIVNRAEGHEVIWGTGEHGYRGTWVQGNILMLHPYRGRQNMHDI